MEKMFEVARHDPMPTRPCLYSLAFQEGSVWADFDKDDLGRLYLVRISYDGHGCCHVKKDVPRMSEADSSALIKHIETYDLASPTAVKTIRDYLYEIREQIWEDALKHHNLI